MWRLFFSASSLKVAFVIILNTYHSHSHFNILFQLYLCVHWNKVSVGDRWTGLHDLWAPHVEDHVLVYYY